MKDRAAGPAQWTELVLDTAIRVGRPRFRLRQTLRVNLRVSKATNVSSLVYMVQKSTWKSEYFFATNDSIGRGVVKIVACQSLLVAKAAIRNIARSNVPMRNVIRRNVTMPNRAKPGMSDPVAAYNSLAPYYRSYAAKRSCYLARVEEIIVRQAQGAHALLDIGAGDGLRALRIAEQLGCHKVVLVEPSTAMQAQCNVPAEFVTCRASEVPLTVPTFDVVTCLWNVLGHLENTEERASVLARLKALLRPGGTIFLDVNHRYNAAAYGWPKTLLRIFYDSLFHSHANGDVEVSWRAGERQIVTHGHVFTSAEMRHIFHLAGMKIKNLWIIDYETGEERQSRFMGNLLYQLQPVF
jgi:2-polyprenyl-3-methyl-5-hydroxy-6-metoxy-1,4-benzoquinol methylase